MRRVAATISSTNLSRSASIPISARRAADLTVSKTPISGGVTVYEPQKTAVYRQKYRHQIMAAAGFSESMVDSRLTKN